MCMTGDDDYWEFYNEFNPKAKVEHTCVECGRTIAKGERYWTQGGKNDGSFVWYKTCAHCTAASRWLDVACEGWIFGRREEDLSDHVVGYEKELRTRPLTRLYRWMRSDWRDRAGELRPLGDVVTLTDEAVAAYRAQYAKATTR